MPWRRPERHLLEPGLNAITIRGDDILIRYAIGRRDKYLNRHAFDQSFVLVGQEAGQFTGEISGLQARQNGNSTRAPDPQFNIDAGWRHGIGFNIG